MNHTKLQLLTGRCRIGNVTFDEDEEDTSEHVLRLLDARRYFGMQHIVEKHQQQRLDGSQCNLDEYLSYTASGEAVFCPPKRVLDGNLCRLVTTGPGAFLGSANELFNYLLPQFLPSKEQLLRKIRQIMDACGSVYDSSAMSGKSLEELVDIGVSVTGGAMFQDPIAYSPLTEQVGSAGSVDISDYDGALGNILSQVYPVCSRLKTTYRRRLIGAAHISTAEVERVYRNMTNEITTLLSTKVDGVPEIYSELYIESQTLLESMKKATHALTPEIRMMRAIFYKQRDINSDYTGFGARMLAMSRGCKTCLMLMSKQIKLFLSLFAAHFRITANVVGASGFYCAAGPPDTGKSHVCAEWLSCLARALQLSSDGSSAKSYTAESRGRDMRCSFEDELKDLLTDGSDAASGAGIKAKQTLVSNGILTYERLVFDEGRQDFVLRVIKKAERQMRVTCTNALKNVPAAIQSRMSIHPITREGNTVESQSNKLSAGTLISLRDSATNSMLRRAFMLHTQLFSALQGRYVIASHSSFSICN